MLCIAANCAEMKTREFSADYRDDNKYKYAIYVNNNMTSNLRSFLRAINATTFNFCFVYSVCRVSHCFTDSTHSNVFAFVTASDQASKTPSECHAFMCSKRKMVRSNQSCGGQCHAISPYYYTTPLEDLIPIGL